MSLKRMMPDVYALMRQVENSLHPLLPRPSSRIPPASLIEPLTDVRETPQKYIITAEMPGVKQSDIQFEHPDQHTIVIRGQVKEESSKDLSHVSKERYYGLMERILRMPRAINAKAAQASLSNGILTVEVPKMESKHDHVEIAWKQTSEDRHHDISPSNANVNKE